MWCPLATVTGLSLTTPTRIGGPISMTRTWDMTQKPKRRQNENMEPQSAQRNSLCPQKRFLLKDNVALISCAIEVHSTSSPVLLENIYEEAL